MEFKKEYGRYLDHTKGNMMSVERSSIILVPELLSKIENKIDEEYNKFRNPEYLIVSKNVYFHLKVIYNKKGFEGDVLFYSVGKYKMKILMVDNVPDEYFDITYEEPYQKYKN